jgi:hypothetical protein
LPTLQFLCHSHSLQPHSTVSHCAGDLPFTRWHFPNTRPPHPPVFSSILFFLLSAFWPQEAPSLSLNGRRNISLCMAQANTPPPLTRQYPIGVSQSGPTRDNIPMGVCQCLMDHSGQSLPRESKVTPKGSLPTVSHCAGDLPFTRWHFPNTRPPHPPVFSSILFFLLRAFWPQEAPSLSLNGRRNISLCMAQANTPPPLTRQYPMGVSQSGPTRDNIPMGVCQCLMDHSGQSLPRESKVTPKGSLPPRL